MNVYSVLTEFKFDVSEALANSEALQSQLGKVANAADRVHESMAQAAMSFLGQIGFYGGIGGAIYGAIKASEKFEASQRSIAGLFMSNKLFGYDEIPQAMDAAAGSMARMRSLAQEFSLPVNDMVATTKGLSAVLLNQGLDDSSLSKSIDLSRFYLKSAPILGVDPGLAQNQLVNMLMGHASGNDTLAQRLMGDTDLKKYGGGHGAGGQMGKFNALPAAKRLEELSKALKQLAGNAHLNKLEAESLSKQIQRLGDNFFGIFGIMKGFIDPVKNMMKGLLLELNLWLEKDGKQVFDNLGAMIAAVTADPGKLYATVQQLRHVKKDMESTGHALAVEAGYHAISGILSYFEIISGTLIWAIVKYFGKALWSLVAFVAPLITLSGVLTVAWNVIKFLHFAITGILAPLMFWFSIMQGISRGFGYAQIINLKWMKDNAVRISEAFGTIKNALAKLWSPFEFLIEGVAQLTSHLLSHPILWGAMLSGLEMFGELLNWLGDFVVDIVAELSGVLAGAWQMISNLFKGNFTGMIEDIDLTMNDAYKKLWDSYHQPAMAKIDNSQVRTGVTNIDRVVINNAFKEQMEPDRVAFALKEQLLKAAANPTQASGRGFGGRAAAGG